MGYRSDKQMEVNGLTCGFNMPHMVKSLNGEAASLPPYAIQPVFLVDEYPACPESWMRSNENSASYFVVIRENHGMWLDFTKNAHNDHDVAVIVSVQGINPITGIKTDQFPPHLEQYRKNCPKHNISFQAQRFCLQCGYKWPGQNYLATTGDTPLWIDGWRTEDGTVRQYYFTSDESKGVAAQMIGPNRVFCIGIAFYLSKDQKPKPEPVFFRSGGAMKGFGDTTRGITRSVSDSHLFKSFEIGAGDKIKQRIAPDPQEITYWQDSPAGFIYINYVTQEFAETIFAGGKRDMSKGGEGAFAGIASGNPFSV